MCISSSWTVIVNVKFWQFLFNVKYTLFLLIFVCHLLNFVTFRDLFKIDFFSRFTAKMDVTVDVQLLKQGLKRPNFAVMLMLQHRKGYLCIFAHYVISI